MLPDLRILTCHYVRDFPWNFPSLSAPYWRLYMNNSAGAQLIFREERVAMVAGRLYIIPPDTPFGSQTENVIDHFFVHFTLGGILHDPMPGIYPREPSGSEKELVKEIMESAVISNAERGQLDFSPPRKQLELTAAALCCRVLADLPGGLTYDAVQDTVVRRVIGLIESKKAVKLSGEEMARCAMVSERTLRRRFLDCIGETPQAFLLRKRIERACIDLHFSSLSIDQIAEAAGFCDRAHFSRIFKKLRGMGPAAYRNVMEELNP